MDCLRYCGASGARQDSATGPIPSCRLYVQAALQRANRLYMTAGARARDPRTLPWIGLDNAVQNIPFLLVGFI